MKMFALARFGAQPFLESAQIDIDGLERGDRVILKTPRGTELARLETQPEPVPEGMKMPFIGAVLRRATSEDLARQRNLDFEARIRSHRACLERIAHHKLVMRLVYVEHLLGHERVYFYFTAPNRVDFRELVKDLAKVERTRIELRQIGEREAARLVGDYQACGQKLCCKSFLRELPPVPMSMARLQRQTLDPGKLSGQCGKLKCCMRYENEVYLELRTKVPERGSVVLVDGQKAEVVGIDVYNQRLTVDTDTGARRSVGAGETEILPGESRQQLRRNRRRDDDDPDDRGGPKGSGGGHASGGGASPSGGMGSGEGSKGSAQGADEPGGSSWNRSAEAPSGGLLSRLLRLRLARETAKVVGAREAAGGTGCGGCAGCGCGHASARQPRSLEDFYRALFPAWVAT